VGLKSTAMNSNATMRPLSNLSVLSWQSPGNSIQFGRVLHRRSTNAFNSESLSSRDSKVSRSLAFEKPIWYEKLLKCVHTPGLTRFRVDSPRMHSLHKLSFSRAFLCMVSMLHVKLVDCCANALALHTSTFYHQLDAFRVIHLPP